MSRVRVTCKAPAAPPRTVASGYPLINGRMADISDCTIELVGDDGKVTPIDGVRRIYFAVACDNEPAELTLHVHGDVEIDIDVDETQLTTDPEDEHGREEETGRVHDGSDDVRSEHGDAQRSPARDGNS